MSGYESTGYELSVKEKCLIDMTFGKIRDAGCMFLDEFEDSKKHWKRNRFHMIVLAAMREVDLIRSQYGEVIGAEYRDRRSMGLFGSS